MSAKRDVTQAKLNFRIQYIDGRESNVSLERFFRPSVNNAVTIDILMRRKNNVSQYLVITSANNRNKK